MHFYSGIAEPKPVEEIKQGIRFEFVGETQILPIQHDGSWREEIPHYFLEIKLKSIAFSNDRGDDHVHPLLYLSSYLGVPCVHKKRVGPF